MKITLSPVRMDSPLTASLAGEVLTLNGTPVDLAGVTEGTPYEAHGSAWIAGPVERIAGELHLTLVLPHGPQPPEETRFPVPLDVADGTLPLPPYEAEEEIASE